MTGTMRFALVVVVAAFAWSALADLATAQDAPRPGPLPADHPDVYLRDSFEAEEWIAQARRHASKGDWAGASSNLHRVVEVHADKLTRVAAGYYVSIPQRVSRLIASWPPEGLQAYRRETEPQARQQLAEARRQRRIEPLLAVADRYFCTSSGADAADLVGQLALEAGDFPLAVMMYSRLLAEHPDRAALRVRALPPLAIAHALAGQAEAAQALAAQAAHAPQGSPEVTWMGRSQPLASLIESLLVEVRPAAEPEVAFSWPLFGGDPARNRAAALGVDRLAILWRLEQIGDATLVPEEDRSTAYRRALDRGRFLAMNPVVANETVYIQDSQRVWALELRSGKLAWRYNGFAEARGDSLSADTELSRWYAPTVFGSRVYACLGSEVVSYYGYEPPESTSALVCLDASSGEELWRVDRARLGSAFEEMDFESTPIVQAGKVYVVVRRKRSFGFEDCFLCRLDADDGAVEFRTHLGSASTGGFGYRRSTLTIPALFEDTVYVVSNLGTIAAVDGHSGRVRWLRLYERISEAQWRRQGRGSTQDLRPWEFNPLICSAERLFVLPTDATSLLVLDRTTGDVTHSASLEELAWIQSLLSVDGSRIYGVGKQAFCYDLEAGTMVWRSELPEDQEPLGRGILTDQQLLVPTGGGVCAFDRRNGGVAVQPGEVSGGGNLLALPGLLLQAGSDHLTAYARKGDVLNRLRRRLEDSPADPIPALDLAELLFRTGDTAESLAALDRAIARAGGFARPIKARLKRRIFDDCLAFAEALADRPDVEAKLTHGLYRRAAQCPPDALAHLTYRWRWAALHERAGSFGEAVDLYQQAIADRTLRETEYAAEGDRPEPAGRLAEAQIARLIGLHGREVYERFDKQAAQWLAAAANAEDLGLLVRLLETYPNSQSAPAALEARGRLLLRRGDTLEAVRAFYAALFRYPRQADAPALMKQIADCYLQAGHPEHAWRWLTKAAREHPEATVEIDGRRLTLRQYRDRLGDIRSRVEPSRPHLDPPIEDGYQRPFNEPFWLLDPLFAAAPQASWRTFLVYVAQGLRAFTAETNEELWESPAPCPHRPELLLVTPQGMVLATGHRIFALDATAGRRLWQHGRRPPELDEPQADPEDFAAFVSFGLAGRTLVALREDGGAICLQTDTGRVVWQRQLEYHPAGAVAMSSSRIVYHALRFGQPIYCLLDAASGEPIRVIEPEDDRQPEHLMLTLEGFVLVVTSQTVDCFDPATARRIWHLRRDGGILAGAVKLDVDGLYLSDDGQHLEKLRLTDGQTIWRSKPPSDPVHRGTDSMTIGLYDGQVLVSTESRVFVLSSTDGRLLWEGTVPRGIRFGHRFLTESYFVAADNPPENFQNQHVAYFYDLRRASGLIPAAGGIKTLGVFDDLKRITPRDGALLLQDGQTLHAWTSAAPEGQ